MFSLYDRVSSCQQPEDIAPHHYMDMESRLSPEKDVAKVEYGRDNGRRMADRWGHFLNLEVALKCTELVLLIVCTILLSQVKYEYGDDSEYKIYPIVIFSTFINLTVFRMVSIAFQWHVSKMLIVFMNCIAAIFIGGSSGVTFCIWYFIPISPKNSHLIGTNFLLAETLTSLLTAIVYLIDIGNNINTLKSLTF